MDEITGITRDGKSVLKMTGPNVQMTEEFAKGSDMTDEEVKKRKKKKEIVDEVKE